MLASVNEVATDEDISYDPTTGQLRLTETDPSGQGDTGEVGEEGQGDNIPPMGGGGQLRCPGRGDDEDEGDSHTGDDTCDEEVSEVDGAGLEYDPDETEGAGEPDPLDTTVPIGEAAGEETAEKRTCVVDRGDTPLQGWAGDRSVGRGEAHSVLWTTTRSAGCRG